MSPSEGRIWWLRIVPLVVGSLAVGTDAWIIAGYLPRLASDLHVSLGEAGLAVTVFAVWYAVSAPILAALTSATPPRRVLTWALVGLAAANLLCAFSPTFGVFLVGRTIAAMGASTVTPGSAVLAARIASPEHRGRALSLIILGLSVATAIGVPLGSALSAVASWRVSLMGVAALSILAAVLIRWTAPDAAGGAKTTVGVRLAPLKEPLVLQIVAVTVLGMAASYVPYAYTATLLGPDEQGWLVVVLATYGVGALCGALASGQLTDAVGSTRTSALAYTLMTLSLASLALRPGPAVTAALAFVWGASAWMQTPPQQSRLLKAFPEDGSVVVGINASALYGGIGLGNALGGVLLPFGPVVMCLAGAGVAACAFAWNLVVGRRLAR